MVVNLLVPIIMSSYILFAYFEIFYMCKHPQRERERERGGKRETVTYFLKTKILKQFQTSNA